MNSSQRIVLNTVATYTRSVLAVGMGIFSSRWVLNTLGQTDYGLFSIVGSLIVFVVFLNNAMAASVIRHFAYSIGQGGNDEVNQWFNAAFSIHFCLSILLILIGWPIGEYVIKHILTIPANRIIVCLWVFRFSLISTFVAMISVPFAAMFTAKQYIAELAVWGGLYSFLTFTLAWFLSYSPGDHLMFYAVGMVGIVVFIQGAQIIRAVIVFRECRIIRKLWFDMGKVRVMFTFAVWNMIDPLGAMLSNQGTAILLNLFFGPKINASYGIANQVSAQTNQLATSMIGAFSPEITTSEGRGDRKRMLSLANRASKFGTILIMLFAIPLMIEMDYVLKIWLREPPMYTALFCQLILVTMLIDRLSTGYMLAVSAHGKIAGFQATIGTAKILTLPLAWLFLKLGYAPTSVGIAFIIIQTICSFGRVLWVRHLFGEPIKKWLFEVIFRCVVIGIITIITILPLHWYLSPSIIRLIIAITVSSVVTLLLSWHIGVDVMERKFIVNTIQQLVRKTIIVFSTNRRN